MNTPDENTILADLMSLIRSAEMWVGQYRKYQDASSVRNAAYALGKLAGGYLIASDAMVVPKDVTDAVNRVSQVWEELI